MTSSNGSTLVPYRPSPNTLARTDDIFAQQLPGPASVRSAVGRPARRGAVYVAAVVGAIGYWSAFAPLDGGAVAPGIIGPDSQRRTVQHYEGGIVAALHVRDGDTVTAGQPLLTLENIQPEATVRTLEADHRTLLAMAARLDAEKEGRDRIAFPAAVLEAEDAKTRRLVLDQRHLFDSRRRLLGSRLDVTRQRMAQLREQIAGFELQVTSAKAQLALLREEIEGKEHLVKLKLIPKPEVLRLHRVVAEIEGRRGEHLAGIARAREQISEMEMQSLALQAERAEQVATQLDDTRTKISDIEQKLAVSRDVLKRTVITAPVDGVVVDMKHKTVGGVVVKSQPILDVVPARDHLIVDARVALNDVDVVRAGLPAQVHLTAYASRGTPKVAGIVTTVSADRMVDEATRQPYYLVRVSIAKPEIERIQPPIELVPGMAADVMIVTERRTLVSYLMQPFMDAWRRSFREV